MRSAVCIAFVLSLPQILFAQTLSEQAVECLQRWNGAIEKELISFAVDIHCIEFARVADRSALDPIATHDLHVIRAGEQWHIYNQRTLAGTDLRFEMLRRSDDWIICAWRKSDSQWKLMTSPYGAIGDQVSSDNHLSESLWDLKYLLGMYRREGTDSAIGTLLKASDREAKSTSDGIEVSAKEGENHFQATFAGPAATFPSEMKIAYVSSHQKQALNVPTIRAENETAENGPEAAQSRQHLKRVKHQFTIKIQTRPSSRLPETIESIETVMDGDDTFVRHAHNKLVWSARPIDKDFSHESLKFPLPNEARVRNAKGQSLFWNDGRLTKH